MPISPGQVLYNRYRIVKLLGRGQGAVPYLASIVLVLWSTLLVSCGTEAELTSHPTQLTPAVETIIAPTAVYPQPTHTKTSISSASTHTTPAPTETAAPTLLPTRAIDVDMVLIDAGEFLMGSTDADADAASDEKPQHKVYLAAYYMDRTEVTNAMYRACVEAGFCTPPTQTGSATRANYYDNPDFDDYPVISINWNQAVAYCGWRKARLPTEAEWEKAARGTDGRIYPWEDQTDCSRANYGGANGCMGDTAKAGSYVAGTSPYGLLDISGNAWEWVNDWYLDVFYEVSPFRNPKGPPSGERRIVRGGSWNYGAILLRAANRQYYAPAYTNDDLGLRCVRSP